MSPDAAVVADFIARRERARAAATHARCAELLASLPALVSLLSSRGVTRVWLFGSLAWGDAHEASDIDLAVEGLDADAELAALGELLGRAKAPVDLVRLEDAPAALAERIRREGRRLDG